MDIFSVCTWRCSNRDALGISGFFVVHNDYRNTCWQTVLKNIQTMFFFFGKTVVFDSHTSSFFLNLIWIAFTGWSLALEATLVGIVCCITIFGIPFGKQYFKIAHIALTPFGSEIVNSYSNAVAAVCVLL